MTVWNAPSLVRDGPMRRVFLSLTQFLQQRLRAVSVRLSATAGQSIPSGVWTALSWNVVTFDDDGFYASASPTQLTVPDGWDGVYAVWAAADLQTVSQRIRVLVNGTQNAVVTGSGVSCMDQMAVGAVISIEVYQSSGGAIAVPSDAVCGVSRIGDL